jgi:hypothetical protein
MHPMHRPQQTPASLTPPYRYPPSRTLHVSKKSPLPPTGRPPVHVHVVPSYMFSSGVRRETGTTHKPALRSHSHSPRTRTADDDGAPARVPGLPGWDADASLDDARDEEVREARMRMAIHRTGSETTPQPQPQPQPQDAQKASSPSNPNPNPNSRGRSRYRYRG